VVSKVVLEVVLVFGDERTFGAFKQLFWLDVHLSLVYPVVFFVYANKDALLAFVHFSVARSGLSIAGKVGVVVMVRIGRTGCG